MVGALLGAMHGHEWLGQLHQVQDAAYIVRISDELVRGVARYPSGPSISSRTVVRQLERDSQESGKFADGRDYGVLQRSLISEDPWTTRFQLQLHDGQTAIVDQVRRTPPSHSSISASNVARPTDPDTPRGTDRDRSDESRSEVRVTIPVSNISEIARFYARLLGTSIPINNGAADVSAGLRFAEDSRQPALWNADARLTISVSDLGATAERMETLIIRDPSRGDYIEIVDPDGRSIAVRASHT
jgi:hypothetical protein